MIFDLNNPRLALLYGFVAQARLNQHTLQRVANTQDTFLVIEILGESTVYSHEECQLIYSHLLMQGLIDAATTT